MSCDPGQRMGACPFLDSLLRNWLVVVHFLYYLARYAIGHFFCRGTVPRLFQSSKRQGVGTRTPGNFFGDCNGQRQYLLGKFGISWEYMGSQGI